VSRLVEKYALNLVALASLVVIGLAWAATS
jgi:hypothetical protein